MTKRNIHRRLHYLIWRSDLEMTRLGLALGSILWALLLFWPGSLFEAYPATYRLMDGIASSWTRSLAKHQNCEANPHRHRPVAEYSRLDSG